MVESPGRGQYQLGPSIAALGLAALRHSNSFEVVRAEAVLLSDRTELGVAVLSWTPRGTCIIYVHEGARRGPFDLRNGPVPTLRTGGGNVFLAYLDPALTHSIVTEEAAAQGISTREGRELHASIGGTVRKTGYAVTKLVELPNYMSVSAPVWTSDDRLGYALTIVGPSIVIDATTRSDQIEQLLASARKLSRQLGASPAHWAGT